jgi:hypothetical protein
VGRILYIAARRRWREARGLLGATTTQNTRATSHRT